MKWQWMRQPAGLLKRHFQVSMTLKTIVSPTETIVDEPNSLNSREVVLLLTSMMQIRLRTPESRKEVVSEPNSLNSRE